MDKVFKNLYLGVSADTALEILSENGSRDFTLVVSVTDEGTTLHNLYKALAAHRHQKFLFALEAKELLPATIDSLMRFFFLANYGFKNHSPLLAYTGTIPVAIVDKVTQWCTLQGFDHPMCSLIKNLAEEVQSTDDFVFVPSSQQGRFLSLFYKKVVALEWLSHQIVIQITKQADVASLRSGLENICQSLKENHAGVYLALARFVSLERELNEKNAVIRFQEIEIKNQKLYNSLMRGGGLSNESQRTPYSGKTIEIEKFNSECKRLWTEIGRLRNEIAWYKRTYEERSLAGTIKEKLFGNRKQR